MFVSGPAGSKMWPTQLTHASVIAFRASGEDGSVSWNMATCMEHLGALGWHVFGSSDRFPTRKFKSVIETLKLTPQQVKTLTGNSMHLLTQMSFMLYILAHCGKKKEGQSNQPARIGSWEEF